VYGLNPRIRAMVRTWKPFLVAKTVENDHYMEEHMILNEGMRSNFPQHPIFPGKAPRNLSRGGISRLPPYGNRVTHTKITTCISMETSATYHSSPMTQEGPQPY
jgi:hypothetical protein